ncbi:MAG: hypothetical protein KME17_15285 [Cyanosarcina radialis HA8281-LM2]|jgi:hypothetical protein|nr:hypothetical protein [Cyanosarcina radialis HA8281-LM2]
MNGIILAFMCYRVGFLSGAYLHDLKIRYLTLLEKESLEKQLLFEIRDLLSQKLLEIVEDNPEPTLSSLMEHCPPGFRYGKAWELWTQECYRAIAKVRSLPLL